MKENYISKEGLEKLKTELNELKTIKRPEVIYLKMLNIMKPEKIKVLLKEKFKK
jgi:transcription elongation GreA/GreB family factor